MIILIAGGAGFIGSHLCEKYLKEGHRVICLDNLQTTGSTKNIESFLPNPVFRFVRGDIIQPISFPEKIDWIFNFACAGSYTSYQYNPVHTMKTNTLGVINMLELARKHGARVMQASTSEVYGDPLETPQKETYRGNVNILGPRACYDEGKRAAETLFMDYHREYGADVKIIRIFNTYGPRMDINDGRAITNFIMNALADSDLTIYGDGSHTRSFQYIDDLLEGIDRMMKKDDFIGPVNLGNTGEITVHELAELVIRKTGSKSKIAYAASASDDPKRRCPDISLTKEELGWEPNVSLEEGLVKTIEHFRAVERPDKKVLVFATTYYPDLGPAEQALFDLSKEMSDAEFHIVTTKFKKGRPAFEKIGNNFIHRVGWGSGADKYLLPVVGAFRALKLHRRHNYRFVWSIMASYGGLAARLLKVLDRDVNVLLMSHQTENYKGQPIKSKLAGAVASVADSTVLGGGTAFMSQVRRAYADILNRRQRKLDRPK
ncbi:MAG: GDP-mannose 4,6-dehydratase [Candidatus Sungbacteria bacterium]|nr:GDP-mannose 4,6-dehydratase [Candidatus Sungbacteria bacterium]